jgi:hypothetical protein
MTHGSWDSGCISCGVILDVSPGCFGDVQKEGLQATGILAGVSKANGFKSVSALLEKVPADKQALLCTKVCKPSLAYLEYLHQKNLKNLLYLRHTKEGSCAIFRSAVSLLDWCSISWWEVVTCGNSCFVFVDSFIHSFEPGILQVSAGTVPVMRHELPHAFQAGCNMELELDLKFCTRGPRPP